MAVGLFNSTTGVNYQLYLGGTPVGAPVPGNTGSSITFGNQTANCLEVEEERGQEAVVATRG